MPSPPPPSPAFPCYMLFWVFSYIIFVKRRIPTWGDFQARRHKKHEAMGLEKSLGAMGGVNNVIANLPFFQRRWQSSWMSVTGMMEEGSCQKHVRVVGQDTYRVIFNSLVHDLLIKTFTWFVTKKSSKGSDLKPVEVYLSL